MNSETELALYMALESLKEWIAIWETIEEWQAPMYQDRGEKLLKLTKEDIARIRKVLSTRQPD